ncbi:hypothetical protein ALC62_07126 [Cyphomyrmex costatus]|uniref:Uncharacterized protein n=1 Tax=Cyphomyrmex costatus TaxID=456900 RepID=A0A151IIF6_9HYME|nr:hypothetical protein ALC62_07126 [Cyphomyrmex costatus]
MIKNAYEINRRFCFAIRLLGIGLSGIQVFCSVMELEKMSKSTFYSILKHIHIAVKAVTKRRKMKRDSSVKSVPAKVKTLSLTNKLMIKLSIYYGLAILRNSDSVEEMNKAVWATFFHLSSTDKNPQHSYCPQRLTSWCEYQKFKAQNQQVTFTYPPAFDDTATILKPIYEELSSNDLLERCLGKNNQNNNKSFNHCVWNLAPKHIFVGKMTLEIATLTAACVFNEGFMPVLKIMETIGVTIGPKGMAYAQIYKDCRIQNAEKSTSDAAKLARSSRRSEKVAENEVFEETEGLLYSPSIAD